MTYTFRCPDCRCSWQKEMKMSEYKLPKWCEVCGWAVSPQRRIYDIPNIKFNGRGFTKSVKEEE